MVEKRKALPLLVKQSDNIIHRNIKIAFRLFKSICEGVGEILTLSRDIRPVTMQ